jgi:NTE family protein
MDVMLILQGGGSLGAYECGVYRALAPWIKEKGHRLSVVAGTSIGAVNASVIASRYGDADHGVVALTGLWQSLSEASALFLPPLGSLAGVNAVWTSLLFGNPRMFQPIVPLWTLMPPVTWAPFTAFYDTTPVQKTLSKYFTTLGPHHADPRLMLTAVDLRTDKVTTFDSVETAITPRHVLASCSLPPFFPATELDGRSYWDGGLWSNTPMREVLNALQNKPESQGPAPLSECLVVLVELFAPPNKNPGPIRANWDVWARRDQIIFQNKSEYDFKAASAYNAHIDFVLEARRLLNFVPPSEQVALKEVAACVDEELAKLKDSRRFRLNIQRIVHENDATGDVSREIDFSPQRIEALIKQGEDNARKRLTNDRFD